MAGQSYEGYEGEGNPLTLPGAPGWGLSFNVENRLTRGGTATAALLRCGYRGDGLRAWKHSPSGTTFFVYDGDVPLLELSALGAVQALNTWGAAGLAWRRRPSQGDVFYTFDLIGSPVHRLDAGGNAPLLGSTRGARP